MELKQYLKMSQQLVMTPQLQQAIKLLQLSRLELSDTIAQEMLENPVLEDDVEAMASEDVSKDIDEQFKASDLAPSATESPAETAERREAAEADMGVKEVGAESEMDWDSFVENYQEYSYSPGAGSVRLNDDEMPTLEQTVAASENLYEHLAEQLGTTPLTDLERSVAEELIGNVNDHGYIARGTCEALAEAFEMDLDEVEAVLEVIQEFDPVGVAARDLRECLLIQATVFHPEHGTLQQVISDHLGHLENRNVNAILKALDIESGDLSEIVDILSTLEPKPGRRFSSGAAHYITPDVHIYKVGDEYQVILNEDGLPKLKISNFYRNRIKAGAASSEEKSFIQDKFRSAVWLIRSIHQRQNTIRKVTESIARFQRDFLDKGVSELRPLILRDVAEDIGMHESTISRVTTNKYVHTPQGIFELKYFFNSRITSSSGEDLASESVKQRIKAMIAKEDTAKPMSDQKICDLLGDEGTNIARRTVAKYREMLGILPSSKRKRLF